MVDEAVITSKDKEILELEERCKALEVELRLAYYYDACRGGAGHNEAKKYARDKIKEIII